MEIDLRVKESDVPDHLKIVIYRILQEAMNNVARHSQASTAYISLKKTKNIVEFEVRDNGRGFHMSETLKAKSGLGIAGIKERVKLSDGSFRILSGMDQGTSVRALWQV